MFEPRIRVVDLETAGNGPNDVCEIGWQDLVFEDDGIWHVTEERGSLLVNPGRPMSPDTMAELIFSMPRSLMPRFGSKWHQTSFDLPGIDALAAHRAAFEQGYCTPRFTGDTPWICT